MYVYNYRTEDRYGRPVASFAVLADDEPGWRPGPYVFDQWGCGGEFRYPTVNISDWADRVEELEASDNPFAVVVLAHLKALETAGDWPRRREWKLRLLKGLRGRGWDQNDALQLYKLIYWFLTLPPNDERLVLAEIKADEKEKQMPYVTIIEKMAMEEGEARGLLAGIALALKVKFGEAGRRLAPEVGAIGDLATLRRVADSIEAAATVEDVRRAWSE